MARVRHLVNRPVFQAAQHKYPQVYTNSHNKIVPVILQRFHFIVHQKMQTCQNPNSQNRKTQTKKRILHYKLRALVSSQSNIIMEGRVGAVAEWIRRRTADREIGLRPDVWRLCPWARHFTPSCSVARMTT